MLIMGLLIMCFDAAVVFVAKSSLLIKFALAILWIANVWPFLFCQGLTYVGIYYLSTTYQN
jgi:hypothetical protein